MQRITMKQLEQLCARINKAAGTPLTYCEKVGQTPFKANVGHYHLGGAYGGVRLEQTMNEGGGIHALTGYNTKRELYNLMNMFLLSLYTNKQEVA